uniref:MATE efflux family protein 2ic n=1 Tax=Rhizophora mucronata TaxID=61149 RepID=A0A2P2M5W0_RHIMU
MNALAFVIDGLYYGVSDFGYAAYSMVVVGFFSCMFLLLAAPVFGLAGVWTGLFLFMTLRVVAGIWRYNSISKLFIVSIIIVSPDVQSGCHWLGVLYQLTRADTAELLQAVGIPNLPNELTALELERDTLG